MEIPWPSTSPVEPQGLPRWWNIPSAAMDWVLWPVEGTGTACLEGPCQMGVSEQRGGSEGGRGRYEGQRASRG